MCTNSVSPPRSSSRQVFTSASTGELFSASSASCQWKRIKPPLVKTWNASSIATAVSVIHNALAGRRSVVARAFEWPRGVGRNKARATRGLRDLDEVSRCARVTMSVGAQLAEIFEFARGNGAMMSDHQP